MSRRSLGLIALLALSVHAAYVALFMRGYRPNSDADSYFEIGRAIARGRGYVFTLPFEFVHATAIRPPLYPTLIAVAFRLFGTHVAVAQSVNIVAGSVAAVLGALIAYRISGPRAGVCAGIIVAIYPPLIANDVTVLVESLAVALLFGLVLLLLDGRTVWAGVVLGLLMLDRASAQWFLLVVAAWVLWRMSWRHAGMLVAVAVLVVAPWVIRNTVHVGGPTLVATNGFNLNATYSDEARQSHSFVDAYFDPRFARLRFEATSEVDLDSKLRKRALHELREHPTEVLGVARTNVAKWLELRPGGNRDPERLDGRNLDVRAWTLPLFYVVTAAGLFALVRGRRSAGVQLLALAAAYFTLVSIVSIAVPRLRSLFDGCMAIGAGLALAWAIDRRTSISAEPPPVRPMNTRRFVTVLAVIAFTFGVSGIAWQTQTHTQARRAVVAAVDRDASALAALAAQYRAADTTGKPPRLAQNDVDAIRDLTSVLGQRASQVGASQESDVADALRKVRVVSHEADVIALLSAAEYIAADRDHRAASIDRVRDRYERQVRANDPSLEPWETVKSGLSIEGARATVERLGNGGS